MDANTSLWSLFASSFLAATLLPGGSEFVLYGVLATHPDQKWQAIAIATLGNTLGGLISYAIGRIVPEPKHAKSVDIVRRYGPAALLLSWVPFVGDALCVAAGWLRFKPLPVTLCMALGKFARYVAVAALPSY